METILIAIVLLLCLASVIVERKLARAEIDDEYRRLSEQGQADVRGGLWKAWVTMELMFGVRQLRHETSRIYLNTMRILGIVILLLAAFIMIFF